MLTRQDFVFLAKLVKDHGGKLHESWKMARDITYWIEGRKPVNDRFDRGKFMDEALGKPKRPAIEAKMIEAMFAPACEKIVLDQAGKANPLRINFPD